MQYVSVRERRTTRWGLDANGTVTLAPQAPGWPATLLDALRAGPDHLAACRRSLLDGDGDSATAAMERLAPLPCPPRNVMCLGMNYAAHTSEALRARGRDAGQPEHPVVFTKATSSVIGPGAAIPLSSAPTTQLDWEVELGVVIGTGGRDIPAERALEHVLGYTVVNDVSARDLQFRHKQFFLGKSLDGACPVGPGIVPVEEIPDPHDLRLWCDVNGDRQQDGHTGDQVFRIPDIIALLSSIMRLEPGDLIATGTPAGVGFAQEPPRFLEPGDVVECGVEGIGLLRNVVE